MLQVGYEKQFKILVKQLVCLAQLNTHALVQSAVWKRKIYQSVYYTQYLSIPLDFAAYYAHTYLHTGNLLSMWLTRRSDVES